MHHSPPPPSSMPQSRANTSSSRGAEQLPAQLLDHCIVCFEEHLYSQAFSLLSSALTAGTGSSRDAHIPPPQHLAFAATLAVHPQLTTRTTSPEKHAAAAFALTYLKQLNALLGARTAGLDKAFRFSDSAGQSRSKRSTTQGSTAFSEDDENQPRRIRSPYANKQSLWTNADDFWSVVGWAFNCSVAHRHRWERWKLWLEFMLDVLEDDLEARLPDATKAYQIGGTAAVRTLLKDSLIAQYLSPIGEGRNNKRRLMRAIFADGKQKSLAEFGEIWRHETKPPKQKKDDRLSKRRKLDLENGEFGDYFDNASDEESPGSSIRRSRSTTALPSAQQSRAVSERLGESNDEEDGASTPTRSSSLTSADKFGGSESICLRQRLLALLTRFSSMNPDAFLDNEDLFDLYTEFLRPLPLPIFQQFVQPSRPYLGPNSQASLNQMLLRPLLVAAAPQYNENAFTQAEFEEYYASYAANNTSAVDNAKVSLLIESLLRLLWKSGNLESTQRLAQLVEQGIKARQEKVAFDGRKRVGVNAKADEEASVVLENSAENMLLVLELVGVT